MVDGAAAALADWLTIRGSEPGPLFVNIWKGGHLKGNRLTTQAVYHILQKRAAPIIAHLRCLRKRTYSPQPIQPLPGYRKKERPKAEYAAGVNDFAVNGQNWRVNGRGARLDAGERVA